MTYASTRRWQRLVLTSTLLFSLGGCLGPNPGFFITSAAANATIMTLVSGWVNSVLNADQ